MSTKEERRQAQEAEVVAIRDSFSKAVSTVIVDFRGMSVELVSDIRGRFRAKGIEYRVVKNTLVRKALAGTPLGDNKTLGDHLKGPTAIAWSYEDPSAAAKIIRDFRKEGDDQQMPALKCAVLDGEVLDAARVEGELASLPGKDEARAQLLAQLLAPMQTLVRQLGAPAQNLAYALDARVQQG